MIYCFDTSALNHLHDDSEMESLCDGIIATNAVWITSLNVIEAGINKDSHRRISLLQLQKKLAQNRRPLQIPNVLIRQLAVEYALRSSRGEFSIGEDQEEIWIALNKPHLIDESMRQQLYVWKKKLEDEFRQGHQSARPHFQALFDRGLVSRPPNASALLRHFLRNQDFLLEAVNTIYEPATGQKLEKEELFQFFETVPHWAFYFLGWGHAIYSRAIQEHNYGKKNVGTMDLWCACYLPGCDVFVTADICQFKALRLINVFNQRDTKVLTYSQLRGRLLVL